MPDSQQPPFWGPAYHERDLDALLSGQPGNLPPALRPVESTLAALRAAPTRGELSDEAAARAEFRALAAPQVHWTAPAEHGAVTDDTLVLPLAEHLLPPADRRPPRAARHRRRRGTWAGRRSAIAVTSVATVAVVVIAVGVAGALPGSIGQLLSVGSHPTSAAASSAASSTAPTRRSVGSLYGSGAVHPTPSAAVTGTATVSPSATTAASTLCREFYQPSWQLSQTARRALFTELSQLAGGPDKVGGYCFHYLSAWDKTQRVYPPPPFGGVPGGPGDGGNPGAGDQGVGNPGGGNSDSANSGGGNSGAENQAPGAGDRAPSAAAGISAPARAYVGAGHGQLG